MPTPSSRSTAPSKLGRGIRPGFTLLELAIAMMIMSVILVILVNTFLGTRKAQGQAVTMAGLKVAGSAAIEKMYLELSQAKRLMASMDVAPPGEDIGRAYFAKLDLPTTHLRPIPELNMRFPRIVPNGKFTAMGTAPGQLSPAHVGNTLLMVTRYGEIPLATDGVKMKFGSVGVDGKQEERLLTPDKPFRLARYRFVAYYLDEEKLPKGTPKFKGGMAHVMNLVRWESLNYADKGEVEGLLGQVNKLSHKQDIWADLRNKYKVVALWDPTQIDPNLAFYQMNTTNGKLELMNASIQRASVKPITNTNLEPYALGMVAFNNNPDFAPLDSLAGNGKVLQVPRFGEIGTAAPYGFEVAIVGSNAARAVLLRLALAARLQQGGKIFGWSHQQVVQLMDN